MLVRAVRLRFGIPCEPSGGAVGVALLPKVQDGLGGRGVRGIGGHELQEIEWFGGVALHADVGGAGEEAVAGCAGGLGLHPGDGFGG